VLIKEIQSLGLDVKLGRQSELEYK
jgi:hypothetical protein